MEKSETWFQANPAPSEEQTRFREEAQSVLSWEQPAEQPAETSPDQVHTLLFMIEVGGSVAVVDGLYTEAIKISADLQDEAGVGLQASVRRDYALFLLKRKRPAEGRDQFEQGHAVVQRFREKEPMALKADFIEHTRRWAWFIATAWEDELRDPKRALELAKLVIEEAPDDYEIWRIRGIAAYRVSQFAEAEQALRKSLELKSDATPEPSLFLAMTCWQLGRLDEAREWNRKASAWFQANPNAPPSMVRFREEANTVLSREPGQVKP